MSQTKKKFMLLIWSYFIHFFSCLFLLFHITQPQTHWLGVLAQNLHFKYTTHNTFKIKYRTAHHNNLFFLDFNSSLTSHVSFFPASIKYIHFSATIWFYIVRVCKWVAISIKRLFNCIILQWKSKNKVIMSDLLSQNKKKVIYEKKRVKEK